MGLDQYLVMEYVSEVDGSEELGTIGLADFRKANEIHNWFQTNVARREIENCERIKVDAEQLAGLAQTIKRVLEDHSLAPELLPTVSGFFFGSTDYDDWYFRDLENSLHKIEGALDEVLGHDPNTTSVYYYGWW